jgi:predicted phage tail component-like protein
MITLTINGVNLESALGSGSLSINSVKGRGPASRDAELLEVPGRNGAYLRRVKTPPRELDVAITLRASSYVDLRDQVDQLNEIITTEEAVPLVFSDEIDKTYYGVLADSTNWDEIRNFGQGTLKFVCPDPYKYEAEQSALFVNDTATVSVGGNEETLPRFEATALGDLTHVDFVRGDGTYMRIGRVATIDDTIYEKETLVMHDTMDSTTGWTTPTYVDNGTITGTMAASGGAFTVGTWGPAESPAVWQGPSLKRSIGEALDQFQIDVLLEMLNVGTNRIGMIEIYLLDANNNTVAKIGTEDINRTANVIQNKMQLGPTTNRHNHHITADYPSGWNNFNGIISLRRELVNGVYKYHPYFAKIDANGKHYWRSTYYNYYDFSNEYTAPITQIQVAIRFKVPGSYAEMKVFDIKAYRINEQPNGIPTILKTGDELVIDHKTEDILINGQPRKDLKDFGASYFTLKPGSNTIVSYPVDALDTTVFWRNKYK